MIRTPRMPPSLRLGLVLAVAGWTTGCGRGTDRANRLPPALSSALASGGALNAGGETPLWALQIRPKALSFSSERIASLSVANTEPAKIANGAVWKGQAIGHPFRVTVMAARCRDEATGLDYPMRAEVEAGGNVYRGCAAEAGQGLGPRG